MARIDTMTLEFCGLDEGDDLYCKSIQVEWVHSEDAIFGYEPVAYCQALINAEMLVNHESCSWFPFDHDCDELPF